MSDRNEKNRSWTSRFVALVIASALFPLETTCVPGVVAGQPPVKAEQLASSTQLDAQADRVSTGEILAEILKVVNGNQATLDAVSTIQSKVTHTMVKTTSVNGKKANWKTQATSRVRYDGNHLRVDVLKSRRLGEDVAPELISRAASIAESAEGNRAAASLLPPSLPPVGEIYIHSKVSTIHYFPEKKGSSFGLRIGIPSADRMTS